MVWIFVVHELALYLFNCKLIHNMTQHPKSQQKTQRYEPNDLLPTDDGLSLKIYTAV